MFSPVRLSRPSALAILAAVISVVSLLPVMGFAYVHSKSVENSARTVVEAVGTLAEVRRTSENLGSLARLSAASGELGWRQTYVVTRENYESSMRRVLRLLPALADAPEAEQARLAHEALRAREDFAFQFLRAGRVDRAQAMVNDDFYREQTLIRGRTLVQFIDNAETAMLASLARAKSQLYWTLTTGLVLLLANLGLWAWVIHDAQMQSYRLELARRRLERANAQIAERSQRREASFFEDSPIPMFENDFSAVMPALQALKAEGVEDFDDWARAHPRELFKLNMQTTIVRCNAAALDLLGASDLESLRQTPDRYFQREYAASFLAYLRELWDGHHHYRDVTRIYSAEGTPIDAIISARPARGAERTLETVVCSLVDITEQKRIAAALETAREDAERANRTKSEFLAVMSHEIRTPLNGVLGMSHALARTDLAPDQSEMVGVIEQSGTSLLSILNDLLDLSKIEAGRLELETTDFDIEALVIGAEALFKEKAAEKQLHCNISIDDAARGHYLGDPTRIRQILFNLISNAIKFTDHGEIFVDIRRTTDADGNTMLVGRVRDTGIGMTQEQQERLFTSFMQADASTTRNFGGTGLGLAICKKLCEQMNGWIRCDSVPGEGSTFTFAVEAEYWGLLDDQRIDNSSMEAEDLCASDASSDRPLRILAAEDNPSHRLVLQAILAPAGAELPVAENGLEAVEYWQAGEFDIILMDVQMPIMDGPSATRLIRDRELTSARDRIPILALTANAMTHQVREYLAAGMDGHVAKPIEPTRLFEGIMSAMTASAATGAELTDVA